MITIYGISNCDTVKKARRWMDANGLSYEFHDFRKDGVTVKQIKRWVKMLGWESVLNRRSATWRGLSDKDKATPSEKKSITLMANNPTLIKRPVISMDNDFLVGFSETEYSSKFIK